MAPFEIFPGAFYVPAFLLPDDQRTVMTRVLTFAERGADFYRPRVRGGGLMRCEMLCLGLHWNAMTYAYEPVRSDYDGQPAPPLPADLGAFAVRAARAVGLTMRPDVCIVNRYTAEGKMGLHQDKDERPETLDAGIPIVSLSLGDTATFIVGGTRRREATRAVALHSGDAFVMGGSSRLRYHGVTHVAGGTAPSALRLVGRISLTFRQFSLARAAKP